VLFLRTHTGAPGEGTLESIYPVRLVPCSVRHPRFRHLPWGKGRERHSFVALAECAPCTGGGYELPGETSPFLGAIFQVR
jgi:hypothetical protein